MLRIIEYPNINTLSFDQYLLTKTYIESARRFKQCHLNMPGGKKAIIFTTTNPAYGRH